MVPAGVTGGTLGVWEWRSMVGDICTGERMRGEEGQGRNRMRGGEGENKEEWRKEAFKEFVVPYASRPFSVSLN